MEGVVRGNWNEMQSTPVFLPGDSHGQSRLAECSPKGRKERNMIEVTEHVSSVNTIQNKIESIYITLESHLLIIPVNLIFQRQIISYFHQLRLAYGLLGFYTDRIM